LIDYFKKSIANLLVKAGFSANIKCVGWLIEMISYFITVLLYPGRTILSRAVTYGDIL